MAKKYDLSKFDRNTKLEFIRLSIDEKSTTANYLVGENEDIRIPQHSTLILQKRIKGDVEDIDVEITIQKHGLMDTKYGGNYVSHYISTVIKGVDSHGYAYSFTKYDRAKFYESTDKFNQAVTRLVKKYDFNEFLKY